MKSYDIDTAIAEMILTIEYHLCILLTNNNYLKSLKEYFQIHDKEYFKNIDHLGYDKLRPFIKEALTDLYTIEYLYDLRESK